MHLAPSVASLRQLRDPARVARRRKRATAQFRAAFSIKPDDTVAFCGLTQNSKFREDGDLVNAMVTFYAYPALEPARREFLAFGLAKVFDDLGVPYKAMTYAIEAKSAASAAV